MRMNEHVVFRVKTVFYCGELLYGKDEATVDKVSIFRRWHEIDCKEVQETSENLEF